SRFMTEELSKIIEAAEESTSQILERARASTREQIVEAHRLWEQVQAEVARLATWRDGAASVVRSVQSAVEKARGEIEGLPDRIQSALAPAVEAMEKVDAGMAKFAMAATFPATTTWRRRRERSFANSPGDRMKEARTSRTAPSSGGLEPSSSAASRKWRADQYPDGELVELVPRWTAALMARSRISRVIGPLCT